MREVLVTAFLIAAWMMAGTPISVAQEARPQTWSEVKCARYAAAWHEALVRFGRHGLSREFMDRHESFLTSGCRNRQRICPQSQAELDLANAMTLAAMNSGAASTFVPFTCRN